LRGGSAKIAAEERDERPEAALDATLLSIWSFLENPARMTGVLIVGLGAALLFLLFALYPFSTD
jgi:hypothetical protein